MKKTLWGMLLMAACALALCGAAVPPEAQAGPRVLRMALGDPENSEMGVVGRTFKEYVEKKSNGNILVELHYAGALGDESITVQNVSAGTLDLSLAGIANVSAHVHELGILTLPYLFNNIGEVVTATSGAPAELLNSHALEAGFRILAWAYTDYRYISNSRYPVSSLDDMRGLRFRVPPNPILAETYKAFGATPVPIPWNETTDALKRGVVDGQCYGYIGFRAMRFAEIGQKHITEAHYTYQLQPLIMSVKVYHGFSQDERDMLKAAGKAAQAAGLAYVTAESEKARQDLIEQGVTITRLKDEDVWRQAAIRDVWPKMADYVGGRRAINIFLQACGKRPWTP